MAANNLVSVTGRLGDNVELKTLPSGESLGTGRIAVNDGFGDKRKTYWFNFTVFGKRAENLAKQTGKGSNVTLSGKGVLDEWEKDGQKRVTYKIMVDDYNLLDSKAESKAAPQATSAPADDDDGGFQTPSF